jgi:DDE family transposase
MRIRRKGNDKRVTFAEPPWTEDSPQWQALDRELPPDHLARVVVGQMAALDLAPLVASYLGTGSKPYRPDLLLRIALIEIQRGRHSPTHWYQDTKDNKGLQWAGWGIQPSRTCWHHFYDRAAPLLLAWNANVLERAQERGQTTATRAAQDGTLVAANASRHQLLNHERLDKRLAQLDAVLAPPAVAPAAADAPVPAGDAPAPTAAPTPVPQPTPGWMAHTPAGRQAQRQRYARARDHLDDLRSANARRNPAKRLDPKKIVISGGDPEARPGRDKDKVFRPLYNVQLLSDLDAPFYLGYQVFAQTSDANTLGPLFERTTDLVGHKPGVLLVDAGYVTGADLALCDAAEVTVYGPWRENDYSKKKDTFMDKQQFSWLPAENAYRCPHGQLLTPIGKERRQHVDGRSEVQYRYRCAPVHCQACPLHAHCTSNPARGRSLRRSEHEDLITAHQQRMATPEAKELYKLRKQTVERGFADWKQHRAFRRFWGRGLARAEAQVGFLVLAHNLLALATAPTLPKNEPAIAVTSSKNSP